jgi:hypothetical protein
MDDQLFQMLLSAHHTLQHQYYIAAKFLFSFMYFCLQLAFSIFLTFLRHNSETVNFIRCNCSGLLHFEKQVLENYSHL